MVNKRKRKGQKGEGVLLHNVAAGKMNIRRGSRRKRMGQKVLFKPKERTINGPDGKIGSRVHPLETKLKKEKDAHSSGKGGRGRFPEVF